MKLKRVKINHKSKDMKYVFITGMFRSGTTLLARMLSAHPNIAVSSDPSLPIFKFLRSHMFRKIGVNIPPNYPLEDYYFSSKHIEYIYNLVSSDLNQKFEDDMDKLKAEVRKYAYPFAPKVVDNLGKLSGRTFSEIVDSLLSIISEVHSSMGKKPKVVGMKEVWANEFVLPIHRTFDDFLFIEIVRDPRAVSASKNVKESKYPWLFLSRQWRKLYAFTVFNKHNIPPEKHLVVKYEELAHNPDDTAKKICSFLEVEFSEDIVNPEKFKDELGNPWLQNTSWGKPKKAFDTEAIERWKNVLEEKERRFIESLCLPEMSIFGYETKWDFSELKSTIEEFIIFPFEVEQNKLAGWIKEFYNFDGIAYSQEMAKELIRYKFLEIEGDDSFPERTEKILKTAFLFDEVYYEAKKVCKK